MTDTDDPHDDEVLAAEYVLHLLDAQDLQGFEARQRDDAGLRDLVRRWEMQLPPIADAVDAVERIAGEAPEGRVLELWLIAQGSDTPVSLGLLAASGTTRIRVPDTIAPGVRTGTVAISEEPPGGSPSGVPTGDVLATATFEDL